MCKQHIESFACVENASCKPFFASNLLGRFTLIFDPPILSKGMLHWIHPQQKHHIPWFIICEQQQKKERKERYVY